MGHRRAGLWAGTATLHVCPQLRETSACSRAPRALLHPTARSPLLGCPSGRLQPVLPPRSPVPPKHPQLPRWPQPSQGSARQGPAPRFSTEKGKVHLQRDSLGPRSQAFVRSELGASHRHSARLCSTGGSGEAFQQRSRSTPDQGAGRVWKASSSEENNRVLHRLFRQLSTSISWPETAGERSCWWLIKYNCRLAGTRETQPAGRPRQCLGRTNPSSPKRCSGQNGRGTRLVSYVLLQETLAQHQLVFQRRKGSPPVRR